MYLLCAWLSVILPSYYDSHKDRQSPIANRGGYLLRDRGWGGTIITLAKELPRPFLVFTVAEETRVAVCWISSLVDDSSSLAIAVTATVLVAASLSQGSHSQEEQTQAEHHRSLHIWIVQMVLRWRDPNKWSGLGEAHLLIPKLSRATTLPETLWPSDPLTLWPSDPLTLWQTLRDLGALLTMIFFHDLTFAIVDKNNSQRRRNTLY